MENPAPAADILDTSQAGQRIVQGGAVKILGFAIVTLVAVAGVALVSRYLGPERFGQFQTVLALVTIVQTVTDLGMAPLGIREFSQRTGEQRDRFMAVLLGLRIASTVIGVALAVAVAIALGYDETMVLGTALLGAGLLLGMMQGTLAIPIVAQLRIGLTTALDLLRQVGQTALYVALVLTGASLLPFYAVTIPVHAALVIVTAVLVRGVISLRPSFDLREWVALIRPTLVFALAVAAGQLYIYTALILCEMVTSSVQTGLFAASFRVYIIVAAVPALLVTVAFPLLSRAARDDRERLAYATQRLFEGTAILGGAALVGCVLGAAPIIAVVAGPQFSDAVPVLQIQGGALALTFVVATWGFTLLAVHRHRPMILANLVAMVVSATSVLVLARSHGAIGAAAATLLGEATLAAGYVFALSRLDEAMRPRASRPLLVLPAIAAGLAAGVLAPVPAVPATVIGLLIYAAALLVVRAVPDEILEYVPGPLGAAARR